MYRTKNDIDARRDTFPSTFLNFGGLDGKYVQDMYLDTASTISSPSASPTSTCTSSDGAISPLSPIASSTPSPTRLAPPAVAAVTAQQQHYFGNLAVANLMGTANPAALLTQTPYFLNNNYSNGIATNKQQQQHYQPYQHQHLQQQQQLTAAFVAQQHYQQQQQELQQQNEISKSLKTFAMLTSYKTGNEPSHLYSPDAPEAVMQEFASNGYTADDLNCFYQQLYDASNMLFAHNNANGGCSNLNLNIINCSNNSAGSGLNCNGVNPYHFNSNYNDVRKHLWMWHLAQQQHQQQQQYLPSAAPPSPTVRQQQHQQHASTVAAAAANIDYNNQNTNKRPPKRYSTKSDKFAAVKHCVFCENNNEAEAVVKSHTVRDALGRVLCPKLRSYTCPICKASGDNAHTVKYCPQKPIITMEDAVKAESIRQFKNSMHKYGMQV